MLPIEALENHEHIVDKIATRHGVAFHEAEQACYSEERHVRRGREGLYKVFGPSEEGRYLLVVLADQGSGVWRIVTARDMTGQERRLYRRARGLG